MIDESVANEELSAEETAVLEPEATIPEATEAPVVAQEDEKKPPEGYVPHGALHEERQKRKGLESEFRSFKETSERRLQELIQAIQRPKAEPPPIPSVEVDPIEHFRAKTEMLERETAEQKAWRAQQEAEMHQRRQTEQFIGHYRNAVNQFAQTAPDYSEAFNHLYSDRRAELKAMGYADEQADAILLRDEQAIALKAFQDGVNPAERFYALAKLRGYGPKAAPKPDRVEQLQKGQAAAKSLSAAGGAAPSGGLSIEAIANMSEEEFSRLKDSDIRRALGA